MPEQGSAMTGQPAGPLDLVIAEVRQRDRDRYLSILWSPATVRPALFALHGLDLELAHIVAGTTEPMIGEIRLAWWREALQGLDRGTVPAQPLLQLAAAELLPRGIAGAELAVLEDRWLPMIDADVVPPGYVEGGGLLFGLAARLLGGDAATADRLGRAWALRDAWTEKAPAPLRPLLGLVRLAGRDDPPASLGRQWLLAKTIAFGR